MSYAEKYKHFLQKSVVRGKIVKVPYFKEQGLEVFLEKLKTQGWLAVFMNTNKGCFVLDLAELYANCVFANRVVTSTANGRKLRFNAKELGAILGVPSEGFDVYVHEDKNMLGTERLVELTRRLSQKLDLLAPQFVKTGEMTPLHRLIFWLIIKNVIPRGQGRNLADSMDLCHADLLD